MPKTRRVATRSSSVRRVKNPATTVVTKRTSAKSSGGRTVARSADTGRFEVTLESKGGRTVSVNSKDEARMLNRLEKLIAVNQRR